MNAKSLNSPVDLIGVLDAAGANPYAEEGSPAWNLARLGAAVAELIDAARDYVGPTNDPRIGWCGHLPSNNDVFRCERCDEENLDSSFIEHKPECSAARLLTALAAVEVQP